MIQKTPIKFAHASLARPSVDESVVHANENALESALKESVASDSEPPRAVSATTSGAHIAAPVLDKPAVCIPHTPHSVVEDHSPKVRPSRVYPIHPLRMPQALVYLLRRRAMRKR